MKKKIVLALLAAQTVASTVLADDVSYDSSALARASAYEAELTALLEAEFVGKPPSGGRAMLADSRLGAELLAGGLFRLQRNINHMHRLGIERVQIGVSWPMFQDDIGNAEAYPYTYREIAKTVRNNGQKITVVVAPHRTDSNYYVGFPLFDACEDVVNRMVETARLAHTYIAPERLIIDLSPTSLSMSHGCDDDAARAGKLTQKVVRKLRRGVADLGVLVNLDDDPDYLATVMKTNADFIGIATSETVVAGPRDLVQRLTTMADTIQAAKKSKRVAVARLWLNKLAESGSGADYFSHDTVPGEVSAAADLWSVTDKQLGSLARQLEDSDRFDFVTLYETDLFMGAHVRPDLLVPLDPSNGIDRFRELSAADRLTIRLNAKRLVIEAMREEEMARRAAEQTASE